MAYDIGPKISIAGEKEFNNQIKKIGGNLKVLGSQLNAITKKYEGNEDSLDALKDKNAVLSKQLSTQKEKLGLLNTQYAKQNDVLNELKQELDKAKKAYGENSVEANKAKIAVSKQEDAIQKLSTSINETQGFIYKLNNQIDTNTSKIKTLTAEDKQATDSLNKLNDTIVKQKTALDNLKTGYQDVILSKGKDSDEAKELAQKIKNLTGEYKTNVSILDEVKQESNKLTGALDDVEKGAEDAGDGFTVMKGAMADITADAIRGLADGLKDLATASDNATAQFQASTGVSAEAMKQYNKQMEELYRGNYGESLDDIARSMAEVKQQTKEVDPTKLKELTKQAITLRDTFGFDIKESIRAVKMLMDQFGISGEEAFNLIAQGAQNGLNKNDDLLDSINEYSVHYQQLGFDAEQFFNSLENGASSGTFSIDKLGDATKEFGIRVKDTANSTTEGFELIGLNADEMRKEFAKGGDSAQKAMKKTLNALFNVNDQVKRNQAGVDLFGTMWEDLGIEGVKALTNVTGNAKKTKKTMQEIDSIKYSTVDAQLGELGRSLKQDVFEPTIKKYLPVVKDGIKWTVTNLPKIEPLIKTIGTAIGTAFAIKKANDFKNSISSLGEKMIDLSATKIPGVGGALKSLGGFISANPWIALATAVGALGIAFIGFTAGQNETIEKLKENAKASKEVRDEWEKMVESRDKATRESAGEFDYYSRLKQELQSLTDANGKVKEGYEGRAKYIVNELNQALGTEITMIDGVIQKYGEQMLTLDDLIAKKRAKAIIDAGEATYTEALSNQTKAMDELRIAEEAYAEKKQSIENTLRELRLKGWSEQQVKLAEEQLWNQDSAKALKETYENRKATLQGYTDTIAQQEYLNKLYMQGSAEDIAVINDYISKSYDDKGKKVVLSTEQQIKNEESLLNYMQTKAKETGDKMYEDQITASQNRLAKLKEELGTQKSTVDEGSLSTSSAWESLGNSNMTAFSKNSEEYRLAAFDQTLRAKKGINEGTKETESAWKALAENGYAELKDGKWQYTKAGEQYAQGIEDGINAKKGSVWDSISRVGSGMLESLREVLDIHSPSRKGKKIGEFFNLGIKGGVDDKKKSVINSVSSLAKEMIKEAEKTDSVFSNTSTKNKAINVSKELLTNAYAKLETEQIIVIKNVIDGKFIGDVAVKRITNMNNMKMRSKGGGI